jgi:dTDP-4-amino-4,6-dideoxygalactose transaminase
MSMAKLAINGGTPVVKRGDLNDTWPVVTQADVKAVTKVAASGNWWRYVPDSQTEAFETEFAAFHDAKHCLALSNGTVAIDAALHAMGVEPGDEVIVPSMTFIATASAVLMARAVPVFADIDPETYQISPKSVEEHITRRTVGILPVHYAGYPVDLDALRRIAKKHKLWIVEDCAHAQGTEWRGRKVGAIGDAGTFSFQQSKALTSGEGGAVVSNNKDVHDRAYAYHHIGRALGAAKYEHTTVGPNYRLTEFQSAVLRTQLRKLQKQTVTKMKNEAAFFDGIKDVPGILPLKPDKRITQRGYYFIVMRYAQEQMNDVPRNRFIAALRAEGLPVSAAYGYPVYKLPAFQEASFGRKGCPINCGHYKGKADYRKVYLPAVEHACRDGQIVLPHQFFVYAGNVRKFARAVRKVSSALDTL